MQSITHIIWDWNGTLLDDTQACVNSVNKMLSDRGLPSLSVGRYREIFGFPVSDFYREIGFILEQEDWDAMAVEFHDLFLSDASTALHAETLQVLETLQSRGYGQSVLSASKQSILDSMITDFGISHLFRRVRGIDNLYGESKMAVGKAMIEEMALEADRIILIGDSLHDYEVALELGARCLLVACGHQSRERLARTGLTVLEALGDVPGCLERLVR